MCRKKPIVFSWSHVFCRILFEQPSFTELLETLYWNSARGYDCTLSDDEPLKAKTKTMAPFQTAYNAGTTQNAIWSSVSPPSGPMPSLVLTETLISRCWVTGFKLRDHQRVLNATVNINRSKQRFRRLGVCIVPFCSIHACGVICLSFIKQQVSVATCESQPEARLAVKEHTLLHPRRPKTSSWSVNQYFSMQLSGASVQVHRIVTLGSWSRDVLASHSFSLGPRLVQNEFRPRSHCSQQRFPVARRSSVSAREPLRRWHFSNAAARWHFSNPGRRDGASRLARWTRSLSGCLISSGPFVVKITGSDRAEAQAFLQKFLEQAMPQGVLAMQAWQI